MADALDILNISSSDASSTPRPRPPRRVAPAPKRPEGMTREVFELIRGEKDYVGPDSPLLSVVDKQEAYKTPKLRMSRHAVRPWVWREFSNPARKDNLMLKHWERLDDNKKVYPFAHFNKPLPIPRFSDAEYQSLLTDPNWTLEETRHLFDLMGRFAGRFIVVQARFGQEEDGPRFQKKRSTVDIKERFYDVCARLDKTRGGTGEQFAFNAEHERKRVAQLELIYSLTQEELDEQEALMREIKKIQSRQQAQERKNKERQKVMMQEQKKKSGIGIKKHLSGTPTQVEVIGGTTSRDFGRGDPAQDNGAPTICLRSSKFLKLSSLGVKRQKALETLFQEQGLDLNPIPTPRVVAEYNALCQEMLELYDFKAALAATQFDIQKTKHRLEQRMPSKNHRIFAKVEKLLEPNPEEDSLSTLMDGASGMTPHKKRKAALEQSNLMKKLKHR
ncbi:unnamed protein product [Cyprideis torosa]|uniref:Uncharacterized protein n=1 Tax=Cyprideis torosa TaxID=163714 RepID=A0A7R8W3T5_9CRUS|nr:unnamed protein product [Cyprideis torosa]CAG0883380.1 unnamed protein product [Cyprideis torosa]